MHSYACMDVCVCVDLFSVLAHLNIYKTTDQHAVRRTDSEIYACELLLQAHTHTRMYADMYMCAQRHSYIFIWRQLGTVLHLCMSFCVHISTYFFEFKFFLDF